MGIAQASLTPIQAAAYARDARRLRAKWRGQPGRLHEELRKLPMEKAAVVCERAVARTMGVEVIEAPWEGRGVRRGAPTVFASMVADAMEGDVFRYSARLRLLQAARRMGIDRFEANLIIAAVQHRARPMRQPRVVEAGWRTPHWVAAIIGIEALMLLGGAWVWHSAGSAEQPAAAQMIQH